MSRAFLIGAGATKSEYDDAPVCIDFFRKLKTHHSGLFKHLNDTIAPLLSQELIKSNIEDVMIKSYEFESSNRTSFLHTIYTGIHKLIVESTISTKEYFNRYIFGGTGGPPTRFFTLINDLRLNKEDFFMTLNYDLCLDREIFFRQRKIDYGLKKPLIGKSDIKVDFDREFSLYHLHGSLNFEIGNGDRFIIHEGAINPIYRAGELNICLIPPGEKKINSFLNPIWKNAESRLGMAKELIIIGCSLNQNDKRLIKLIQSFVSSRGSDKVKVVYKKERDDNSLENHYKTIIGSDLEIYEHGFNIIDGASRTSSIEFIFGS